MVLSSQLAVGVANVSAEVCQLIACNPERLRRDEVLYLIFCFPFQQLRRVAISMWSNLRLSSGESDSHSD